MANHAKNLSQAAEAFSTAVTKWTGSAAAFTTAIAVTIAWAAIGPIFGFSDTWQLAINTSTTIVTFLMVFLIQRTQNKDSLALHLKLNELVAATRGASNRLIDVEELSEVQMRTLERHFRELARLAGKERDISESHTIEEARTRHKGKTAG